MDELTKGTATLLFYDIFGSTRLAIAVWEARGRSSFSYAHPMGCSMRQPSRW